MYAMLFGSDKFEDMIGELMLANQDMMDAMDGYGGEEGMGQAAKGMKEKQVRRKAKCALSLLNKLEVLTGETTDAESGEVRAAMPMAQFLESHAAEAVELAAQPFGAMLLHTIGHMYSVK
eukprot:SAG11_NODE_12479_length_701_cov_1.044850_1_plen_119_part_01